MVRKLFLRWHESIEKGLDASAPNIVIDGITIVDRYAYDEGTADVFRGMQWALWMLKTEDPLTFRRLRRYIDRITVSPLFARGYYHHDRREIRISGSLVTAENPGDVVLCLIHELTHARISAVGIFPMTHEDRSRAEAMCERRVRAFVTKMAQSDVAWAAYLVERIESGLPTGLSSEDYLDLKRADGFVGLRHFGVPRWLLRIAWRLGARHRKGERSLKAVQSSDT